MTTTQQIDAEIAQRESASMAHMSDADIKAWVDRLTAERSQPLYEINVSYARSQKTGDDLFRYRREMARRLAAASKKAA